MEGHDYNPNCGCPGCQFIWAAMEAFKRGLAPVIGTFEPIEGDMARDCDRPDSMLRTWVSGRWWPYFEIQPQQLVTETRAEAVARAPRRLPW